MKHMRVEINNNLPEIYLPAHKTGRNDTQAKANSTMLAIDLGYGMTVDPDKFSNMRKTV